MSRAPRETFAEGLEESLGREATEGTIDASSALDKGGGGATAAALLEEGAAAVVVEDGTEDGVGARERGLESSTLGFAAGLRSKLVLLVLCFEDPSPDDMVRSASSSSSSDESSSRDDPSPKEDFFFKEDEEEAAAVAELGLAEAGGRTATVGEENEPVFVDDANAFWLLPELPAAAIICLMDSVERASAPDEEDGAETLLLSSSGVREALELAVVEEVEAPTTPPPSSLDD